MIPLVVMVATLLLLVLFAGATILNLLHHRRLGGQFLYFAREPDWIGHLFVVWIVAIGITSVATLFGWLPLRPPSLNFILLMTFAIAQHLNSIRVRQVRQRAPGIGVKLM